MTLQIIARRKNFYVRRRQDRVGAALLARFTSFVVVAVAGLAMGILTSLVTYAPGHSWFPHSQGVAWPGVSDLLYFLVIVVALLGRGQSLPDRGTLVELRLPRAPASERLLRPTLIAGRIALAAGMPRWLSPAPPPSGRRCGLKVGTRPSVDVVVAWSA